MIWTARVAHRAADPSAGSDDLYGWLGILGWGGEEPCGGAAATAARLVAEVEVTCAKHRCTDDSAFWQKPTSIGVLTKYTGMESAPSP